MTNSVYLDTNASALPRPETAAAMASALAAGGNPSAVHARGRAARALIEETRDAVAAFLGVGGGGQVVFTSGGTEANAIALLGSGRERILVSAVEHPSVANVGRAVEVIPVDGDGLVDLGALEDMLAADARPAIVAIMLANNETGVIEPVAAAAKIAHKYGALIHTDAVQAMGKIAIDFAAFGVDSLAVSAHKIGGPQGVGALIRAKANTLTARTPGGGQEQGLRGGTENVPGIAGFGAALMAAKSDDLDAIRRLRDDMEARILASAPDAIVFGAGVARLANTTYISMPGVANETQVMAMDLAGICVSAGSACASGKIKGSPVLAAQGIDENVAKTALRISFGPTNTRSDVDALIAAWTQLYEKAAANSEAA